MKMTKTEAVKFYNFLLEHDLNPSTSDFEKNGYNFELFLQFTQMLNKFNKKQIEVIIHKTIAQFENEGK